MASWKLNNEQRTFAEEHHDEVVYGFLTSKKLNRDEYLDIVYEKYLYAVHIYLERPELREKYAFKTVAYGQMMAAVKTYWTYLNRPKRKATAILSLNADDCLRGIRARESCTGVSARLYEKAEAAEQWNQIAPLLTKKETDALLFKAQGYTYREIAKQVGISCAGVGSRFYRLRLRLRANGLALHEGDLA